MCGRWKVNVGWYGNRESFPGMLWVDKAGKLAKFSIIWMVGQLWSLHDENEGTDDHDNNKEEGVTIKPSSVRKVHDMGM